MKIICLHGYFKFHESRVGEVSDFMSTFGLDLSRVEDYFTFTDISSPPEYSIEGQEYLGAVATTTIEGKPWEIFEANGLIYNYDTGLMVPIQSITQLVTINTAGNFFVSDGLILPGSLTDGGSRVKDYAAWFSTDRMQFKYSEVSYV